MFVSCLKVTPKADISRPEIQRYTCITEMRAKPLAEFGHNNCSAWSSAQKHDIVTAAKCAKAYHFMQTYLPKCLNRAVFEGYTFREGTFFYWGEQGWAGASEGRVLSKYFTNWGGSNLFYSQPGEGLSFFRKEKITPWLLFCIYKQSYHSRLI